MAKFTDSENVPDSRPWFPAIFLIVGLAVTAVTAFYSSRSTQLRNRAQFELQAQHTRAVMERRLENYIALLRGTAGFFAAQSNVTQQGFGAYVDRLQLPSNYRGLQGLGFSIRFSRSEEPRILDWLADQGITRFSVWPRTDREEYHAIVYLEPRDARNESAIGYDMFSDPVRRQAMEKARDLGQRTASGKVTLVQESEGEPQSGFLIYVPVYHGGRVPNSLSERRERLLGFVYGAFRMGDLIGNLEPGLLRANSLRIYDGSAPAAENLLFESERPETRSRHWLARGESAALFLEVAGRVWLVEMVSPQVRQAGWWIAPSVLLVGICLSLLFFHFTRSEALARRQAETVAGQLRFSEAALRQSEARFRMMVESARDYAIFSMNLQGNVTSWSSGAERMFGFTEAEAVANHASMIFTPEDRAAGAPEQELGNALKEGCARDDRWHQRKDGSRVFVSGMVRPMEDDSGQRIGFIKIARDVTERLEADARLRYEKEFSDSIINSLPGVFYLFEENGRWLRWNKNLELFTGYSKEEVSRRNPALFFRGADQEKVEQAITRTLEKGEATVEADLIGRDGRSVSCLFTGRRIVIKGKACVMGMGIDISERKQAERELRQAEERLRGYATELEQRVAERTAHVRQSLQSLEDLLYHVAHDLRAPLRSMASFTKILLEDYAVHLDARAQDYARRISNSAHFMDQLVQDLLAYGHLSHTPVNLTAVSLEQQVDDVLEQLAPRIRSVEAQVHVERPLPAVSGHPQIVNQMILNLVSNALKFVPAGTPPRIRIRAEQSETIRLWVEDNGIGIRPEYHARVFRVFERLHGGTQFPGTGIGLALVAKGAERLGGQVGVESVPGEGSRFWLELPRAG